MLQWLKDLLFPRKVLLVLFDGDTKIVTTKRSQAGWVANYYDLMDHQGTVILLKGGKVAGFRIVKAWAPHSGWSQKDLDTMLEG